MLQVSHNLFTSLNQAGLLYCQFKSTDHIKEGLDGDTDLDLLVDSGEYSEFLTLVLKLGFRPTVSGYGSSDHSREGFLGLDEETGKFIYLDVHYSMIIGSDRVRELHSQRIANRILKNRIMHPEYEIFIPSPEDELALLFIRICLKTTWLRWLKTKLGNGSFLRAWDEEKKFLLSRINQPCPNSFIDDPVFEHYYRQFMEGEVDVSIFRSCRRTISSTYFMKVSRVGVYVSFVAKSIFAVLSRLARKTNNFGHNFPRKVFRNIGPMVVFIGIDGSGKSTQKESISNKLRWKMDVVDVYLGAGAGQLNLSFRVLKKIKEIVIDRPSSDSGKQESSSNKKPKRMKFSWLRIVWAVFLALDKRSKFKKIQKLRSHGITIICDRFPQNHVPGFNDGNLLGGPEYLGSCNRFVRNIARWEEKIYKAVFVDNPTIFIHLDIPLEVANSRDRTGNIDYLTRRKSCVDQFNDNYESVVNIDANQPIEQVSTNILQSIWKSRW